MGQGARRQARARARLSRPALPSPPLPSPLPLAQNNCAPLELVREVKRQGRLPVMNFAAGGIATPADAALMMQLGMDGVFVGSGIFHSGDPNKRAKAIATAVAHYNDPKILAEVSKGLGSAMSGTGNIKESQVSFREREGGGLAGAAAPAPHPGYPAKKY